MMKYTAATWHHNNKQASLFDDTDGPIYQHFSMLDGSGVFMADTTAGTLPEDLPLLMKYVGAAQVCAPVTGPYVILCASGSDDVEFINEILDTSEEEQAEDEGLSAHLSGQVVDKIKVIEFNTQGERQAYIDAVNTWTKENNRIYLSISDLAKIQNLAI